MPPMNSARAPTDMRDAEERMRQTKDPRDERDLGVFMDSMMAEAKGWFEAQKDYYALVASERAAKAASGVLSGVVMIVLLGSVLVFLNIAAGLWLGQMLHNMALGFLIVGGAYLVLFLIFQFIWRGKVKDRFVLRIINALHGKD